MTPLQTKIESICKENGIKAKFNSSKLVVFKDKTEKYSITYSSIK